MDVNPRLANRSECMEQGAQCFRRYGHDRNEKNPPGNAPCGKEPHGEVVPLTGPTGDQPSPKVRGNR